jgi:hypothetical protein
MTEKKDDGKQNRLGGSENLYKDYLSQRIDDENIGMSRLGMKSFASHTYLDAVRNQEIALRRQQTKELAQRIGVGDGGEDTEAALLKAATLKKQKAMAKRLSTFPQPATLPNGVTLRLDELKISAFRLTCVFSLGMMP